MLAVLQTIVAGIGGNSGNQTLTMIARAIALGRWALSTSADWSTKKWRWPGSTLIFSGAIGFGDRSDGAEPLLGFVLTLAMTLNLLLAAVMGVVIPILALPSWPGPCPPAPACC